MFADKSHYLVTVILMVIGLYAIMGKENLIKKIIGLNVLQSAVFLFFIAGGYVYGGKAPIIESENISLTSYVNPVVQVLMLTAIVVGVSITAVAIALVVKINKSFHTVEENEIIKKLNE